MAVLFLICCFKWPPPPLTAIHFHLSLPLFCFFSFNLSFLSPAFFSLISDICLQFIFYFFVLYSLVLFFRFYFFFLYSHSFFPSPQSFLSALIICWCQFCLSLSGSGISVFNIVSIVLNGLFEDSPYSH